MEVIAYAIERFSDVIEEAQPLLQAHWEEVEDHRDYIPLSPNYARYAEMEAARKIVVVTGRVAGRLVGYAAFITDFSLHHSTVRWAISDALYVQPEFRGQGAARSLIEIAEQALTDMGACVLHISTKKAHPALGHQLQAMGYAGTETVFAKVLQRPE